MDAKTIIGYVVVGLVCFLLGRWSKGSAGGPMLTQRADWRAAQPVQTPPPLAGAQTPPDANLTAEVAALLRSGNKIAAIKLWRERTGASLLEAKNAVEDYERRS
jgi:ribosomal protein L7/L12